MSWIEISDEDVERLEWLVEALCVTGATMRERKVAGEHLRRLLSTPGPSDGRVDHYAVVHDAVLAALKVESEESVDDAIEAAFNAWQTHHDARSALDTQEEGR